MQGFTSKDARKLIAVELVAVSPLNRTLETALHCFAHLVTPVASTEKNEVLSKVPFIAVESLREQTNWQAPMWPKNIDQA